MKFLYLLLPLLALLSACNDKPNSNKEGAPDKSIPAVETVAVDSPDTTLPLPPPVPAREPIPVKYLLGQFEPSQDENFVKIEAAYTAKSSIYLRKETYDAFKEMHAAAKADGINLQIVSATRNFNYQRGIWERKWTGVTKVSGQNLAQTISDPVERAEKILNYSSMPGTSRHHWGTDLDLNNLNNEWFDSGQGKKIYQWLSRHASEYGFCQTYTPIGEMRPHGYQEEKWHWSYTPLASQYLEDYQALVTPADIKGFKGSEVAEPLNVIEHYVVGVNDDCK